MAGKARFEDYVEFSDDAFHASTAFQNEHMKVIVGAFKEGQFIPVHAPAADLVLYVVDGTAEIVASDRLYRAEPGDIVTIPAGVQRGVRALTELRLLHIVAPPPTEADHRLVRAGVRQNQFRPGRSHTWQSRRS